MVTLFSAPAGGQVAPMADHNQHLFSPAMVALLDTTRSQQPITARDTVALALTDREFERVAKNVAPYLQ